MKNKYNLIGLMILSLIFLGVTITCNYDAEPIVSKIPFTEDKFFWNCNSSTNELKCYTIVQFNNETIQINPKYEDEKEIGLINEYFEPTNKMMMIYFTDERLYMDTRYNTSLICENNGSSYIVSNDIILQLKGISEVTNYMIWMKENAKIFWGLILVIIFAFIIIYGMKLLFGR